MRYPNFIKEGDTVAFVAPAFGCVTEPYHTMFEASLDFWKDRGYATLLGQNCYADCGVGISNTPLKCGEELNSMYVNPRADCLISCGGGELMCEVVPFIDFETIAKSKPKWYLGYSDNTNFTFLSTTLADTAALYGPCAATFGMKPLDVSLEDCLALMEGRKLTFHGYPLWEKEKSDDETNPCAPYQLTEPTHYRAEGGRQVQGRLVGGCLDCLGNLVGTRFDRVKEFSEKYREDGILWFLEACDLSPMSIRRTLWNLREAGWFEHAKGFLIGRPLHFGEAFMGVDQYNAVTSILGQFQVPIFFDLDFGHLPPQIPIISGALAQASLTENNFEITYELK